MLSQPSLTAYMIAHKCVGVSRHLATSGDIFFSQKPPNSDRIQYSKSNGRHEGDKGRHQGDMWQHLSVWQNPGLWTNEIVTDSNGGQIHPVRARNETSASRAIWAHKGRLQLREQCIPGPKSRMRSLGKHPQAPSNAWQAMRADQRNLPFFSLHSFGNSLEMARSALHNAGKRISEPGHNPVSPHTSYHRLHMIKSTYQCEKNCLFVQRYLFFMI